MYHLIPSSTNLYWPSTSQYRHILTQYHQVPIIIHHLVRHSSLFTTHLMSHAQYTRSSFLLTPQHPQQSTTSSYLSLSSSCPGYPLHYHLHDINNNLFQYYRCIDRTIDPFCSVDELPLRSQLAFCLFLNLSMSEHRVRTVRQIFALPVICKITNIRPTWAWDSNVYSDVVMPLLLCTNS